MKDSNLQLRCLLLDVAMKPTVRAHFAAFAFAFLLPQMTKKGQTNKNWQETDPAFNQRTNRMQLF